MPCCKQFSGTQSAAPQTPGTPAAPQVSGQVHAPHLEGAAAAVVHGAAVALEHRSQFAGTHPLLLETAEAVVPVDAVA